MKKEFGESYYHTRMGSTKITTKVASISMKQYFVCYIDAFKQCVSNIEYYFRYASCFDRMYFLHGIIRSINYFVSVYSFFWR